jgi:hypothetical protein
MAEADALPKIVDVEVFDHQLLASIRLTLPHDVKPSPIVVEKMRAADVDLLQRPLDVKQLARDGWAA